MFKDFIEILYKLKLSSNDNPSRRNVAKLLLNSLYGRMGMNEIVTKVKIVETSEVEKFYRSYD